MFTFLFTFLFTWKVLRDLNLDLSLDLIWFKFGFELKYNVNNNLKFVTIHINFFNYSFRYPVNRIYNILHQVCKWYNNDGLTINYVMHFTRNSKLIVLKMQLQPLTVLTIEHIGAGINLAWKRAHWSRVCRGLTEATPKAKMISQKPAAQKKENWVTVLL